MMTRTRSLSRAAAFLVAISSPFIGPLSATNAPASVSVAATWDGLLHESTAAAMVTTLESRPVWEGGRIYTYTHVHIDRAVAGELGTGSEAWVRTMGGVVGKVGQIVEGEAAFAPGDRSLLFLRKGPAGAFVVTARGQGQYPIVDDDPKQPAHVVQSHTIGMILPPRAVAVAPAATPSGTTTPVAPASPAAAGTSAPTAITPSSVAVAAPRLAAEALHGRPVDDVARDIAAAWAAAHAP
jgi:hypothetical protein